MWFVWVARRMSDGQAVSAAVTPPPSAGGLAAADVAARVSRGQVNVDAVAPSRTIGQIVAANVFTRFNAILGGLLVVVLATGDLRDALFGLVLVANSGVGIVQELRAKRALDQLALLRTPEVAALRDGSVTVIRVDEVVVDDVLLLRAGDQIVVDGNVVGADSLEVDESLLTGESDAVAKQLGDEVLSGSFVAAGTGGMRATRVGAQAYAAQLAKEAGAFRLAHSELRAGIDWILRLVTWALVPTAVLLLVSQLRAHAAVSHALSASIAGVVAMVPEGLVLLTSGAFALAVVRLARRQTLVQQLPAVETLARVDVVCVDKTGTLTEGVLSVETVESLTPDVDVEEVLNALATSDPDPNATMRAVAARYPHPVPWPAVRSVPFSSARKWSATVFADRGAWLLGAPEVLLGGRGGDGPVLDRVAELATAGRRVLLLARAAHLPPHAALPEDLQPCALVVLTDRLRTDAPDTVTYFAREGVTIKVISGDDPRTAAAVARQAGIAGAEAGLDARDLPESVEDLIAPVERNAVFGRVTPRQKRAMVTALQRNGHVVAMTGDGVNDVLALKNADIGIGMGSGSSASRAVADVVLLDGAFSSLPAVVAEGRRVIGNIERVAKLFVTKSVYSLLLALAIGVAGLPFPFLPRHLTLVGSLTIGIPGLILALAPNAQRASRGFTRRVLSSAIPAGVVAAAATFVAYYGARLQFDVNLDEARTTATLVLTGVGLAVLAWLVQPLTTGRRLLLAAMAGVFAIVLAAPGMRDFFALNVPPATVTAASVVLVAVCAAALPGLGRLGDRWATRRRDGGSAS